MVIVWTKESEIDYFENLEYLIENWSVQVAKVFIKEVDELLVTLLQQPELHPETNYKSVRKAVVCKQISLYYKLDSDRLYILRFWNNFQHLDKLTLK